MTNAAVDLKETIRRLALEAGFNHAAVSPLRPPARESRALEDWCEEGRHGGMGYMERTLQLRIHPEALWPGGRSVLTLGASYHAGDFPEPPPPAGVWGRVARYAWGLDYHEVIGRRLSELASRIETVRATPGRPRPAADAQPVLERAYAYQAGIGFFGKNTNIIVPGGGSWMFLAELILDFELEPDGPPKPQGCGACRLCVKACPTGALSGDYRLDARRCISYLTIENKGEIPRELRPALGHWVFGCDLCQECCPFNARPLESAWPEFSARSAAGPWLDLREVLSIRSTAAFERRFGRTPLSRPKRRGLLRNACVVAGNLQAGELLGPLSETLRSDSEPLIRAHAAWALGRYEEGRKALREAWTGETDVRVRDEISLALEAA